MDKNAKILIVGHNDIIDRSLLDFLNGNGYANIFSFHAMGINPVIQTSVYDFFQARRPEYIFLASTRSGGIEANEKNPGEFIYHNLESQNNVIYAANKFKVKKLIFFASSCVYPKDTPQPMKEEHLLIGPLEKTSEAYAVAKIAGIKLCQAYRRQYGLNAIVVVPATIYGPHSDTDIKTAHVMGALMGKFIEAKKEKKEDVTIWGTGAARREFLYVDDFVDACLFLMERYNEEEMINLGAGTDISIKELAQLIAEIVGFKGKIFLDRSKPDGALRKLLDNSKVTQLGWRPKVGLKEGIKKIFQ